jgi:hypothetical protein
MATRYKIRSSKDISDAALVVLGNTSNVNSGDQTTIAGITGTKAQFDTAVTDGNFMYVGDAPTSHTHALSEVTDSTTEALGVGSLEVGHASDTTITRASAGVIAVEGVNLLRVGDVTTNATHTGEVTGATTLTVDKTAITGKTAVTAASTDYVLISDTSDTGNLKKALVSDFAGASAPEGTAVLSTGETGGTKFLREDGDGTCSWQTPAAGGSFNGARVYKASGQSIGTTFVAVTFDTENYDTNTYHDNVTNNSRLTIPSDGYYRITGVVTTESNAAAGARIRVDGSTIIAAVAVGNGGASVTNGAIVTTDYYLTTSQYVELLGYFGATVTSTSGAAGCNFSIYKIG